MLRYTYIECLVSFLTCGTGRQTQFAYDVARHCISSRLPIHHRSRCSNDSLPTSKKLKDELCEGYELPRALFLGYFSFRPALGP